MKLWDWHDTAILIWYLQAFLFSMVTLVITISFGLFIWRHGLAEIPVWLNEILVWFAQALLFSLTTLGVMVMMFLERA